jgi:hypothetical protein
MRGKLFISTVIVFSLFISLNCWAQSTFLEEEAGISAYGTLSSVDIAAAAGAYKNIEYQTAEYIIGSVAIEGYPETDDVHVYLNISGDIIAYYLNNEIVSKIIDWIDYRKSGQIRGSKLATALSNVATAMGQILTDIKYFDFRYPQANKIKIITDFVGNATDSFRFLIPGSYIIYNRSWSHHQHQFDCCGTSGNIQLDGVTLSSLSFSGGWRTAEGEVTLAQLTPDIYHTVSLQGDVDGRAYAAIVILYSEN